MHEYVASGPEIMALALAFRSTEVCAVAAWFLFGLACMVGVLGCVRACVRCACRVCVHVCVQGVLVCACRLRVRERVYLNLLQSSSLVAAA